VDNLKVSVIQIPEAVQAYAEENCCYLLGTNISKSELSTKDIIDNYGNQQTVERGFRFLKDPVFFTSSLFLKKPSRIEALLMVMTLALLVYSIAERRLRAALKMQKESLPNQINKPTQTPTLRWIFQLLDGVNRVKVRVDQTVQYMWNGLTELRIKILKLFGAKVRLIYQIS